MEVVEKEIELRELSEAPDRLGNRTPQIVHVQAQLRDVQLASSTGHWQPIAADTGASTRVGARRCVRLPPWAADLHGDNHCHCLRGEVLAAQLCLLRLQW